MADTILKVYNINVYYGNIHAVKGVSFTVNEGEIVTLIGANGAGKSTTLKTVSGLLKPRSGDVLYKGKSIKGVRAHKIVESGLAQVPEGRHVFLHMTVDENLDMGAYTQPASTILWARTPLMLLPLYSTSPVRGFKRPEMVFRVVDLPAPFAPIRVTISPALTVKEISFTAWMLP